MEYGPVIFMFVLGLAACASVGLIVAFCLWDVRAAVEKDVRDLWKKNFRRGT